MEFCAFVFVYGSLKRGYYNHDVLEDSKYWGPAITCEKYLLYDGMFPYMVNPRGTNLVDKSHRVLGEMYRVGSLKILDNLDALEGVPHHYKRETIHIELLGIGNYSVNSYFCNVDYGNLDLCPTNKIDEDIVFEWSKN